MTRRQRRVLAIAAAVVLLLPAAVAALLATPWASRRVEREVRMLLESRFGADVEIDAVSIALLPRVRIEGEGLSLVRAGHEVPLVHIQRFRAEGSPWGLLQREVSLVRVEGLELHVDKGADQGTGGGDREDDSARGDGQGGRGEGDSRDREGSRPADMRLGRIVVEDGLLVILPDDPGRLPLRFQLRSVEMMDFTFDRPARYRAELTNPKPEGLILSEGTFGPWNADAPRLTPLGGTYEFRQARLSTFSGIAGLLDSTGSFDGHLERIAVRGTTVTPDFRLTLANQPVPLETTFAAVVDGTNGNTYLTDIQARLGASALTARGAVASEPGDEGRTVSLEVEVPDGRIEDFVQLAVRGPAPFLRGALALTTSLRLAPGRGSVPERLQLTGRFGVDDGQFENDTVQDKVDELSRRGQGAPDDPSVRDMVSSFGGDFTLQAGVLRLPGVRFAVRGAEVGIAGTYALADRRMDFGGDLRLDATVSQTTTGFKSWLLKLVDPLFRRDGAGAVLPIRIGGTVDDPDFGLDVRRALTPG
ncbi:MAG: AsmA-like C-terminal region-containing protein [Vicinamibacterales bacterium]